MENCFVREVFTDKKIYSVINYLASAVSDFSIIKMEVYLWWLELFKGTVLSTSGAHG